MLFYLILLIINREGKMWLSFYLLVGLVDIWIVFDIMLTVVRMENGVILIFFLFYGGLI